MPHLFQDSRLTHWQGRLARVPRWAWVAFAIGVIIPIVALGVAIVAVALTTGLIVLAAVLLVGGILSLVWRLMHRNKRPAIDRRNNQIVVHSVRVIDP